MKKMGMKMEDLEGVQEVIIRFEDKELIIDEPSVSLMNVMGQETYQIEGKAREVELEYEVEIPDEELSLDGDTEVDFSVQSDKVQVETIQPEQNQESLVSESSLDN